MDANQMTFGCEFETMIPAANCPAVGSYHRGIQIPGLPTGWNAQSDGSIVAPDGYRPVEIVSPVLCGSDGLRQIMIVCEWFARVGAKVNQSTGFHVHIGWSCDRTDAELDRLAKLVANFELALFACTGTKAREASRYCSPIKNDDRFVSKFVNKNRSANVGRFHTLNLTNLENDRTKRTVEFRVFAGTTSALKAVSYVRLCLALVQKAVVSKRSTTWNVRAGTSENFVATGQSELKRLFYGLGWTRGRESNVYGMIDADGAPTLKSCKRELNRLARKYDGRSTPVAVNG